MEFATQPNTASDADAIAALEVLEAARDRLHNTLREAAFSFIAAQREEESTRGCFVSYEAIPTSDNTLTPLLTVSLQGDDNAQTSTKATEKDEGQKTTSVGVCTWVLTETHGERKVAGRGARFKNSEDESKKTNAVTGEEAEEMMNKEQNRVDPVYYVSEHPSAALRDCQAAYRRALQCVVEVVNCQQRALEAAAAVCSKTH